MSRYLTPFLILLAAISWGLRLTHAQPPVSWLTVHGSLPSDIKILRKMGATLTPEARGFKLRTDPRSIKALRQLRLYYAALLAVCVENIAICQSPERSQRPCHHVTLDNKGNFRINDEYDLTSVDVESNHLANYVSVERTLMDISQHILSRYEDALYRYDAGLPDNLSIFNIHCDTGSSLPHLCSF